MRRRLTTLKAKGGHSQNGAPRALIDLAAYYEKRNNVISHLNDNATSPKWDSRYSGWSNPSRPIDSAITLRNIAARSD